MLRAIAAGLLLALAGCASPDPLLFTLAPQPGEVIHSAPGPIQLRRIGLARYLDRSGIVSGATAYRITITDNQRWAEPLAPMLERVLADNLASRLPDRTVYTQSGGLFQRSPVIVEIAIQGLDSNPQGEVVLVAQASIQQPNSRNGPVTTSYRITRQPASASTEDIVAAMSAALGEFSDGLARRLAER